METLPKNRSAVESLTEAFKTGSLVFIILAILHTIIQLFYGIFDVFIGKPLELLFRKIFPKRNEPTQILPDLSKIDPDGKMEDFFTKEFTKLPAGDQLKYKKAMEKVRKDYEENLKKRELEG